MKQLILTGLLTGIAMSVLALRDPTEPVGYVGKTPDQVSQQVLHGLIVRSDQIVAVMGERVLHVGDTYDGEAIIAITPEGLLLSKEGQVRTLPFFSEEVKQAVSK